jgi:hypothetical protein
VNDANGVMVNLNPVLNWGINSSGGPVRAVIC